MLQWDEQFREWASGLNDAQPCHCTTPPLHEAFAKYQHLLRLVLEQGAKRGIQLKSDRVDFEAKWHSCELNAQAETASLPVVQQPTIFSFLNVAKASPEVEQSRLRRPDIPFGDKDLTNVLTQIHLEWLIESSVTYENVALSARMLQLAVGSGVGFRLEDRAVKNKYAELLQEYTAVEKLTAITQLVTILQVATLGSTHQFPFGFIVWAPKLMQPPLLYVGAQKPCLIFLLISQETDQPFQFGTAAYDCLQEADFLQGSNLPSFMADVVQLTNIAMSSYPATVRIEDGRQFLHISEFTAIQCPSCTLCFLNTLGARPCFLHTPGIPTAVAHMLGGLDGTGGLSLIGMITAAVKILNPDWVVIHVVDNAQVQELIDTNEVSAFHVAIPVVWSPVWYAHRTLSRQVPRCIGKNLIHANTIDYTGEYLIFSGTEEWSRLLLSVGENPPE